MKRSFSGGNNHLGPQFPGLIKSTPRYGYHVSPIPKGVYGESSKIVEEVLELVDAEKQGIKIMVLAELADIYGAIEAFAEKYNITMEDLANMSDATRIAFKTGRR
jgi:hypothetical protein